jgi:hypothetical protein
MKWTEEKKAKFIALWQELGTAALAERMLVHRNSILYHLHKLGVQVKRGAQEKGVPAWMEKECAAEPRSAATVDDRSVTGGERPAPNGVTN